MGIINSFLKKIGIKKEQKLLQEGAKDEQETVTRADQLVAEAKEKFNSSLRQATPVEIKINQDVQEDEQIDNKPVLRVFAEKNEGAHIEYVVRLDTGTGALIPISVIREKTEEIHLKDIIAKISDLIGDVQNIDDNDDLEKKRDDIREDMSYLNKRYKIDFTSDMSRMVDEMGFRSEINYQMLVDMLPKSIDVNSLTRAQVIQYGRMLAQRIGTLENIKTPEDAYKAKSSLESFMKSQEKQTARGAIVTANLENLENGEQALDVPTIVALAKKLETIRNEDGVLYATYLKLEENRIIRKLQKDISMYSQGIQNVPENASTCQMADNLAQYLNTTITNASDDRREDIIAYMIDTLQGKGIENYAKNCLQHDTRLKVFLKHNPIEHQQEALEYISARMACFGQVVGTTEPEKDMEKIKNLRDFIETTDYKDEDDSESKKFLYIISQIEIDYIKHNYSPILHEFKKVIDTQR